MRRVSLALWAAVLLSAGCAHLGTMRFDPQAVLADVPADTQQAVLVIPARSPVFAARVSLWERTDSGWARVKGPLPAVTGRNGIALPDAKREGDGRAPSGIFALKRAFGYPDSVKTGLEYRQVNSEDVWIDDPASELYNRWVSGSLRSGSFERLRRDDDLYKYAVIIEYNTQPVVRGAGSAIFLHVWKDKRSATAGCVALSESDVKDILGWLDAAGKPVIVIAPHDKS